MDYLRSEVVKVAKSWLGKNEKDGSFKEIIDEYNKQPNPPRGLKMKYDWSWCAAMWSAIAVKLGYTKIMPVEISCGNLINKAIDMGIWHEKDSYIPSPGDGISYDWDDSGKGDCTGWPEHIGVVIDVDSSNYIHAIEGNYSNSVKERKIKIDDRYIRGFITPKYTDDKSNKTSASVTSTSSKNASDKSSSTKIIKAKGTPTNKKESYAGTYQTMVNLYCRDDAGKSNKALCLIPKGTKVTTDGSYTKKLGLIWLYVEFTYKGVNYKGFSCRAGSNGSNYLKKIS